MLNFVAGMRQLRKIWPALPVLLFLLPSCIERETYPDVPRIEFRRFEKIDNGLAYDDKGILTIGFTDGDGDLGLGSNEIYPPYDTGSMYYYNFFITYYEKQQGEFVAVDLPFTNHSRFPILNTSGSDKPLRGEISIELFINNFSSPYDTIRFDAFITDRALNHSDTITTPPILIQKVEQ
jgi:hypothetical protein